ncbi:hypothetical protein KCV01_g25181, partial [Aureobasidium melanogenum]
MRVVRQRRDRRPRNVAQTSGGCVPRVAPHRIGRLPEAHDHAFHIVEPGDRIQRGQKRIRTRRRHQPDHTRDRLVDHRALDHRQCARGHGRSGPPIHGKTTEADGDLSLVVDHLRVQTDHVVMCRQAAHANRRVGRDRSMDAQFVKRQQLVRSRTLVQQVTQPFARQDDAITELRQRDGLRKHVMHTFGWPRTALYEQRFVRRAHDVERHIPRGVFP